MKRAIVNLRVRIDEKALWHKEAKRLGLSVSELVRRSVADFLGK